jgi:hypothetical protein
MPVLYKVRLDLWMACNAPFDFAPFAPHPSLYLIILIATLVISITIDLILLGSVSVDVGNRIFFTLLLLHYWSVIIQLFTFGLSDLCNILLLSYSWPSYCRRTLLSTLHSASYHYHIIGSLAMYTVLLACLYLESALSNIIFKLYYTVVLVNSLRMHL